MSDLTPQVNVIDSVLLRCSIVNSACSLPNDLLQVIPLTNEFGGLVQYSTPFPLYVKCLQGSVNKITLSLFDNDINPLFQRDKEMLFVLSIRDSASV